MIVAVDAASRSGLAVLNPATGRAWVASGRLPHGPTAHRVLSDATHVAIEQLADSIPPRASPSPRP
jgi:hypothetical protein